MNIFILDKVHSKNAMYHSDKHVVKMILESVQMLSSAVRMSGIDAGYKLTHKNHPCSVWTRESIDNYFWLTDFVEALHEEWRYRFGHSSDKNHKSYEVMKSLPIPHLEERGMTPFALAMPEQYKDVDNAVESYRAYYNGEKQHLFGWKNREIPSWIEKID